jgi:hypothetical protein
LTITRTDRQGFQFGGADQVPGRFRKRQLQAENLRTAQQFIQSQGGRVEARLRGFVDAVPDGVRSLRAEVRQALSHRLANGAKADQADAGGLELTDCEIQRHERGGLGMDQEGDGVPIRCPDPAPRDRLGWKIDQVARFAGGCDETQVKAGAARHGTLAEQQDSLPGRRPAHVQQALASVQRSKLQSRPRTLRTF